MEGDSLPRRTRKGCFPWNLARKKILKEREEVSRLKRRAIWMESGDDDTKFFQDVSKGRQQQNTIWEIKKGQ